MDTDPRQRQAGIWGLGGFPLAPYSGGPRVVLHVNPVGRSSRENFVSRISRTSMASCGGVKEGILYEKNGHGRSETLPS